MGREKRGRVPWLLGGAVGGSGALAGLQLIQQAMLPLGIFAFGSRISWVLPAMTAAALAPVRGVLQRAVRRRLRPVLFTRAVVLLLGREATGDGRVETAFWATALAEHAALTLAPRAVAAVAACGVSLALASLAAGGVLVGAVGGVLVAASIAQLARRRTLRSLDEAVVAARTMVAARLFGAARDVGEVSAGAPRDSFIAETAAAAAAWSATEDHFDRTRWRQRGTYAAIVISSLALTVLVVTGVDARSLLNGPKHLTAAALRGGALLLAAVPAAVLAVQVLDELRLVYDRLRSAGLLAHPTPTAAPRPFPTADTTLVARDAVVRYGDRAALAGVSFELPLTGVTAIVGPNGAGKSTLARALAGTLPLSAGHVGIGGVSVQTLDPDGFALVPQTPLLIESLSVADNVRLVARDASEAAIREGLDALGLSCPLQRAAGELSRGEQRRIAVARALLKNPRLLVLDEPDAWLDRAGRATLAAVLRAEGTRRAVVLVTHRADLVRWVDRVLVLSSNHRLEAIGTPAELELRSPTFARLLAEVADESLRLGAEGTRVIRAE